MLSKIFPKLKTKDSVEKFEDERISGYRTVTSRYDYNTEITNLKQSNSYQNALTYFKNNYKTVYKQYKKNIPSYVKDETKLDNINLVQHHFKKNYKENNRIDQWFVDRFKDIKLYSNVKLIDNSDKIIKNYYQLINSNNKTNTGIIELFNDQNSIQKQFNITTDFKKYNNDYIFNYLDTAAPNGTILSLFKELYNSNYFRIDKLQTKNIIYPENNINNDYNDMIIQFSKFVDNFMKNYEITSEDVKNLFFDGDLLRSYGVNSFLLHNIIKNGYNLSGYNLKTEPYKDIDKDYPIIKKDSKINYNSKFYEEITEDIPFNSAIDSKYITYRDSHFIFDSDDLEDLSYWCNPLMPIKIVKEGNKHILYVNYTDSTKRKSSVIKYSSNNNLYTHKSQTQKIKTDLKSSFGNPKINKSINNTSYKTIGLNSGSNVQYSSEEVWFMNKKNCGCYYRSGKHSNNWIIGGCGYFGFNEKTIYSLFLSFGDIFSNHKYDNGLHPNNVLFPEPIYGHYQFNIENSLYNQLSGYTKNYGFDSDNGKSNYNNGSSFVVNPKYANSYISDNVLQSSNGADKSVCRVSAWLGYAYSTNHFKTAPHLWITVRPDRGNECLSGSGEECKKYFDGGTYFNVGVTYPYHISYDLNDAIMNDNSNYGWYKSEWGPVGTRDGLFKQKRSYRSVLNTLIYNQTWDTYNKALFYDGKYWSFGFNENISEVKSTNGFKNELIYISESNAKTSPYSANFIQINDDIIAIDDRIGLIYKTIIENNLDNLAKELTQEMGEWLSSQPEFLIPYRLKGYLNYVSKSRTHGNGLYTNIESPLMPGVIHVDYPILLPHQTYMANKDIEFKSVKTTKGYQVIGFKENSESGFDSLYTSLGSQFSTTASNSLPCLIVPNESNPINYLKDNTLKISSVNMKDLQNFKNKGIGLVFETRPLTIDHQYSEDSEINKAISESNKSGSIKIKLPIVKVEENSTDVKFFYSTYGDDIKILKFVNDSYSTGVSQTTFEGGVDSLLISKNIIKDVLTLPSVFRTRYKSDMKITGY